MSIQLLVLAAIAMAVLVVVRVLRARMGRSPHPDGRARTPFILAFLLLPPIALSFIMGGVTTPTIMRAIGWVLPFVILVGGLSILMSVIAPYFGRLAPRGIRPTLVLALSGRELDPDDAPFDPPVTTALATNMASVRRANDVFPRGTEFPGQIEREGFRYAWDELDAVTSTLEGQIADDRRLGLPVASVARVVAADARSRLDTLQRLYAESGQVWAT